MATCKFCGCIKTESGFPDKSAADFEILVTECARNYREVDETQYTSDKESILRWLLLNATEIDMSMLDLDHNVDKLMRLDDDELNTVLRDHGVFLQLSEQCGYEEEQQSALLYAAKKGDPEIISWLFKYNQTYSTVRYAIFRAAEHGKLKNIIRIFNLGSLDTDLNYVYETIAITAAQNGFFNIIKWVYDVYLKCEASACRSTFNTALQREYYHIAKWLIEQECDILDVDSNGKYPAHIAAKIGKIEVMKWLLDCGFELHDEDYMSSSESILHIAAENGHLNLIKWLLLQGFSMKDRNSEGATPLHLALQGGHMECVEYLIHIDHTNISEKSENGNTVLHLAATSGNLECVKFVLHHGADVTVLNSYKNSPLHAAVKHLDVVKYLVQQGCDIHLKNNEKKSVLATAAMSNYYSVVEWMLQATDADIYDVLNAASSWVSYSHEDNNGDMLTLLLQYLPKWDINALYQNESLLMKTVEKIDAVKLLVENGADVNAVSDTSITVLHTALSYEATQVAEYLIDNGANVNSKDGNGNTVIYRYLALQRDKLNLELIKKLVNAGADLTVKNERGETVLHVAVEMDHVCCTKFLVENGAGVNAINDENISVVQKAAHYNEWNNVKYLVNEANAVVSMEQFNYLLYHAIYFQRLDIVNWIVETCPSPDLLTVQIPELSSVIHNCPYVADTELQLELIKLCVKYGADINGQDWQDETILYKLVDNYTVVKYLLENGAQVDLKSNDGSTPLHKIISMEFNIHINTLMKRANIEEDNANCMQRCYASDLMKTKIVSLLLKFGADINAQDNTGKSVLHAAAANKFSHDVARYLVAKGADVNAQDNEGNSVLHTMYFSDLTSFLIENNANVKTKNRNGETVLHKAAALSDFSSNEQFVNTVELLQNRNIENKQKIANEKVVMSISMQRYLNSISRMTEACDVNEKDNAGFTALHHVAKEGNLHIFKCLIKHGARINDVTNTGDTVLHLAALEQRLDLVKYIITLEPGLLRHKNNNQDNVLHLAVRSESAEVTKCILQQCGKTAVPCINEINRDKISALHLAVANNNLDIVKLLVDKNANLFARNLDNVSPIQIAVKHFYFRILKYLILQVKSKFDDYQELLRTLKTDQSESLLHIALANTNYDMECIDTVKFLLREKLVDINAQDKSGKTALHYVCNQYMYKTITLLVDSGCDINIQDKKGNTAFHVAVKVGSFEITEFLLEHGGNIYMKNARGNSVIQVAAAHGKIKLIKYFFKHNSNINTKNRKGLSLIHNVSSSGGLAMLNFILDIYPNINVHAVTNKQQTALALVLRYKFYHKIVAKLVQFEVTNKADVFSNTELHVACRYASDVHIQQMLAQDADVNIQNKTGDTAVHVAVKHASLESIKLLLSKLANINSYNNKGYNVLHVACTTQNIELIDNLMQTFANNSLTAEGNNVIGVAIQDGKSEVWRYLVERHSDLLAHRNNKGDTILQYCISECSQTSDTLHYLIQHGADVRENNSITGDSCLHVATNFGKMAQVKYLIEQGIDVNARNNKGFTPMHVAAENGYTDFIKLLYEHGGDINCKDNEGNTVLDIAELNNCASVVRYLTDITSR